jgi:hypothetical protein
MINTLLPQKSSPFGFVDLVQCQEWVPINEHNLIVHSKSSPFNLAFVQDLNVFNPPKAVKINVLITLMRLAYLVLHFVSYLFFLALKGAHLKIGYNYFSQRSI